MPAVRILDAVEVLPEGDVLKAIAWKVPKSNDFPEGIKYAFVYIHHGKRILGYDNERAKGHSQASCRFSNRSRNRRDNIFSRHIDVIESIS